MDVSLVESDLHRKSRPSVDATAPSIPVQEFRIAPELRRCCWYVVVGFVVISVVYSWVAGFVGNCVPVESAIGCALFTLISDAMIYPLAWRLRIDSRGISRRRLVWWDVWTWDELASGRIRKLHSFTLCGPLRPWTRRKLRFDFLNSADRQMVVAVINTCYRLPPPPELPAKLTIKSGWRRSAVLDHNGLHLFERDRPFEYTWRDVRRVHLTRWDELRRDFQGLVLTLPDREIAWKVGPCGERAWRGATTEELNEFILKYVEADRITVSVRKEALPTRESIEQQQHALEKSRREMTCGLTIVLVLLAAFLVWIAIVDGLFGALVMGGLLGLLFAPWIVLAWWSRRWELSSLQARLKSFPDQPAMKVRRDTAGDVCSAGETRVVLDN